MRTCTTCVRDLTESQFYSFVQRGKTYLRGSCKRCVLAKQKEAKGPSRRAARRTKEQAAAQTREWRRANPDRVRAWRATYRVRHPEIKAARDHDHYIRNRERLLVYRAEWRRAHRSSQALSDRKRKLARDISGRHTDRDWQKMLRRFDGKCFYCDSIATTKDHVVPLSRGGTDSIGNILPACRSCNSTKHTKFISEWKHGGSARRLSQAA